MKTFKDLGLHPELLGAVERLGFEQPTPIQKETIPAILEARRDIIAMAQTGTGKTAGFGLPIVQQVETGKPGVQALILCPTRELCLQITRDLTAFASGRQGVSLVSVYGGASIETQIKSLKRGAQIVIGTPGRTLDLIKRKALRLETLRWLVLDEADEMLNMGFREDLDAILSKTSSEKQTLLFSATMPEGVRRISASYMQNPREITAGVRNSGADQVSHEYYVVKSHNRYTAVKRLADLNPDIYGIIFCRTRSDAREITSELLSDGYNADALHGDLTQAQRDTVMDRFRKRQIQLLVATDVASRGLDVSELSHIINFTLPDDPEVYVHRSGRTGRAGRAGKSLIILQPKELFMIRRLEKLVGKKFEYRKIPSGQEICEKRLYSLMDRLEKITVNEKEIAPFLPAIVKKFSWLDRDELLKRIVAFEFNRFLDYYRLAGDINASVEPVVHSDQGQGKKRKRKPPAPSSGHKQGRKGKPAAGKRRRAGRTQ
ncbi:MAG: DEAD/DEAH box helicase [Spirochaetales bacterium]|nr:DEAD/DEAH box helicase [Spirochaetales bacterium]